LKTHNFNIISAREIPEHKRLIKMTSLSDSAKPTHFLYPNNLKEIVTLRYNTDLNGGLNYSEVVFVEPLHFLDRQGTTLTMLSWFQISRQVHL
jgi:hypothetical protein